MTVDDILKLVGAGFTAEQITAMSQLESKAPKAEPPKQEEPKPEPPKQEEPKAEPPKQDQQGGMNEVQQMLAEMLGMMRKGNISSMSFEGQQTEDPAEVMAAILSPKAPTK